jgi:hypothetical protein
MLDIHKYHPDLREIYVALPLVTMSGRSSLIGKLLEWCYHEDRMYNTHGAICHALRIAAARGDVHSCRQLITHPCTRLEPTRLAACDAALSGRINVLQFLIDTCCDASSPGLTGSPMCCAAEGGHVAAMQLLMQRGADVNNAEGTPWSGSKFGTQRNFTPLQIASARGHSEVVR